uniref:Mutator-like transposase domain-containing protein n=1 Tax=Magallana gigas TaxID=29159 RepID=K1QHG7_MAGGI
MKPTCEGSFDRKYSRDQERGLAWITSLRCDNSGYQRPPRKLYEEVKSSGPGRKAARLNLAMSAGHLDTCLTTEGMREMLLSTNIHPGSASSMQETANKVGGKGEI